MGFGRKGDPFNHCRRFNAGESHKMLLNFLRDDRLVAELQKYGAFRREMQAYDVFDRWMARIENFRNQVGADVCRRLAGLLQNQPPSINLNTEDQDLLEKYRVFRQNSAEEEARVVQSLHLLLQPAVDEKTSLVVDAVRRGDLDRGGRSS